MAAGGGEKVGRETTNGRNKEEDGAPEEKKSVSRKMRGRSRIDRDLCAEEGYKKKIAQARREV